MKIIKLTKELFRYKSWRMVVGIITDFAFYFIPVLISFITKFVFDEIGEAIPNMDQIWLFVLLFIPLSFLIQIICDFIFAFTGWAFMVLSTILLRRNMLRGVMKLPGASPLSNSTGEAVSRFRGDVRAVVFFLYNVLERFAVAFASIIAYGTMFIYNREITLYLTVPFGFMLILIFLTRRLVVKYRKERRRTAGIVTGTIGEVFKSVQSIKVNNAEHNFLTHFSKINRKRGNAAVKDDILQSAMNSIYMTMLAISTGTILIFAVNAIQSKTFTIGDFALFLTLIESIGRFIWQLGDLAPQYQRTKISYQRMYQLICGKENFPVSQFDLVQRDDIHTHTPSPEIPALMKKEGDRLATLTCENLGYTYPDSTNGISDINFSLKKNSLNVITGRIGSGKTTLLRALLGLVPIKEGTVYWNKIPIDSLEKFAVPPRVAYTAQIPYLFSDTIRKNIAQGLPVSDMEIEESISLAVFDQELHKFESRLDTLVGPKGVNLSGGQKHRVAAARMLVRHPELIVFDDLSSALDVETEAILWERLFREQNKTFLVVSHRPAVLQHADHIIVMNEGKISGQGTLESLLESNLEMQAIYANHANGS